MIQMTLSHHVNEMVVIPVNEKIVTMLVLVIHQIVHHATETKIVNYVKKIQNYVVLDLVVLDHMN